MSIKVSKTEGAAPSTQYPLLMVSRASGDIYYATEARRGVRIAGATAGLATSLDFSNDRRFIPYLGTITLSNEA